MDKNVDLSSVCDGTQKDGSPRQCRFRKFGDSRSCIRCGRISNAVEVVGTKNKKAAAAEIKSALDRVEPSSGTIHIPEGEYIMYRGKLLRVSGQNPRIIRTWAIWSQKRGRWLDNKTGGIETMSEKAAKDWSNPPHSVPVEIEIRPVEKRSHHGK